MYKLVIFDLDGTILDTLDDLADSVNYALGQNGFPVRTKEEVRSFVGNGIRKLIERSVPEGTPEDKTDKVHKIFTDWYKEHCADKTRPYDGVIALLHALRNRGVKTAVVSNKADYAVKELCSKYFPRLLDEAVGERPGIARKPEPDAINELLQSFGVEKEEAVYVGDSEVDVKTADNAGIDCMAAGWGFRSKEVLEQAGAKVIAGDASWLKSYLCENRQDLSGEWYLCWQDIPERTGLPAVEEGLFDNEVLCQVPGDVHIALTEAGVIKDPLVDVNSEDCRFLENKEFWYKKVFYVEKDFLKDTTELIFEGLDLTADIWLNDEYIGSHNNAFIEKKVDVTEKLIIGENTLIVRIDDGVHGVKDKPVDFMEHSWNAEQPYRAWMRKPQFVYGWDWTIWMPTCGIWKDVSLQSYNRAAIRDVVITDTCGGECITEAEEITMKLSVEVEKFRDIDLVVSYEVFGDERFEKTPVSIACGEIKMPVAKETDHISCAEAEIKITAPKLWWPNGAGNPYLYAVRLTVCNDKGEMLQEKMIKHGIRTVAIREDVLDEKSRSFTYVINGQRIFAKGANHVPADCFPGRITAEKTRKLLTMAAECNMNMIRVWGGGIYESDAFMEACDEFGLMVWHDFMFACAYYPDHIPEFYEEIRKEATAAIKRLRSHASLIGWSGNNEIQEMYLSAKTYNKTYHGEPMPWFGGKLYEELLPSLVKELCPDRIYRESSPFGGEEPTSYEEGDQHTWHFTHRPQWEHYLDLWRFTDFDFKFLSEFGIIGAMNLESAKKCISPENLYRNSPEWKHHTNTSVEHKLLDIFVEKYFGLPENMDLQEFTLKSQVLQGELMRHVYDELRSRKFRCSGVLLWTLSDSYGIHNWSVIDYYLAKRPIYYYMKRSLAPVNVSFMGYEVQNFDGMAGYRDYYKNEPKPVELLVTSDLLEDKKVTVSWKLMTFDGKVLKEGEQEDMIPANSMKRVLEVSIAEVKDILVPEETILVAYVHGEEGLLSENRYLLAPYGKLALKAAKVVCKKEKLAEDLCRLTLSSENFVWMLHIATPDGVDPVDNDFDLLPGVERKVVVRVEDADCFIPELHSINPSMEVQMIL